ncbi:hypothetical protein EDD18DRAFT_433836 [Armillaria luteobubalina]|uniref:Uncharacterized protein n=1 Tax=Armillaria luteobubalina TaxID=153913 RepID=A0AA39NVS2_9AGAR|nr:hypothetical protein EDD18DRAFT_433836 [Armillaria luteobubalina]
MTSLNGVPTCGCLPYDMGLSMGLSEAKGAFTIVFIASNLTTCSLTCKPDSAHPHPSPKANASRLTGRPSPDQDQHRRDRREMSTTSPLPRMNSAVRVASFGTISSSSTTVSPNVGSYKGNITHRSWAQLSEELVRQIRPYHLHPIDISPLF